MRISGAMTSRNRRYPLSATPYQSTSPPIIIDFDTYMLLTFAWSPIGTRGGGVAADTVRPVQANRHRPTSRSPSLWSSRDWKNDDGKGAVTPYFLVKHHHPAQATLFFAVSLITIHNSVLPKLNISRSIVSQAVANATTASFISVVGSEFVQK